MFVRSSNKKPRAPSAWTFDFVTGWIPIVYGPNYIARYYEEYGEREWERLDSTPANRVNFHVHRWYMEQFINPGDRVLDIGCGPGRFSIELVRLGARVTAADISPKQLELHRDRVREAGCEHGIEDRHLLDVVDLSSLGDESFDAVVCYGGALSYVFDRFDDALRELLRVTRPGGYVLFSVMSQDGSLRQYFPFVREMIEDFGVDAFQRVLDSGDLVGAIAGEHQLPDVPLGSVAGPPGETSVRNRSGLSGELPGVA